MRYVGVDRWLLYGIADCELHAFVKAEEQKNVQELYWVQFEEYIPTKPELHHKYDSPQHATIDGWIFTWTPGCVRTERKRNLDRTVSTSMR